MVNASTKYDDCFDELRDFLFYMQTIRGRSVRTVNAYYIDLRTFFRYIRKASLPEFANTPFEEVEIRSTTLDEVRAITLSDVYSYLNYTMEERDNNAKTRSRKVSSIRAFFKYLTVTVKLLDDSPVKDLEVPTVKKSLPKYLTLEESLELMNSVNTAFPERDYCIITLLLNCGMRLSELVGINIADIRDNTLRLLGKGNKERIVYLNDSCLYAIDEYLKVRKVPEKSKDKNALFLSQRGTRLSQRRVQQIVDECLKEAGLDGRGISPHKLRHTAATLMYQHGDVDIRVLKEILGHVNLATTEIYTHVANSQIEEAASLSPLSNVKVEAHKAKSLIKKEEELEKDTEK